MNTKPFSEYIKERFTDGVLRGGAHEPDGQACALEAYSQWRGLEWTDSPSALDMPDVRPLNDANWSSDAARTAALVPVIEALADWREWGGKRQNQWVGAVALRTVREVLPVVLRAVGLQTEAEKCEGAENLTAASAAAWAEAKAAAARGAARVAAAGDSVLQLACRIWVEEAERSA